MALPGAFTVQLLIAVSGIGARTVTIPVSSAKDAEDAIAQAKTNLVQVNVTGVVQTA